MKRTMKVPFLAPVQTSVKRAYGIGLFALGAAMLLGCPVYGSGSSAGVSECNDEGVCCDPNTGECSYPYDAGDDSGDDSGGDCSNGCEPGYTCTISNGVAVCLQDQDGGDDDGGSGDATTDGSKPDGSTGGDDGSSPDGSDGSTLPPFTGCTSDNACVADSGAGARCIDGTCVAAANECSDSTQCPTVGSTQEVCVQGVCTPSCSGGATCPSGYACDNGDGGTGACTINPTPCGAADGGAACASGTTCVDEHCVPTCTAGTGDSGPTCSGTGLVCVDNGCIPDQKPVFICSTDGVQDNCDPGSICLHHACYIACAPGDAGADAGNTCQKADNFNVCKPVTLNGTTYDVCGSTSNLGNECDPTQGQICTSASEPVCIDGYCR